MQVRMAQAPPQPGYARTGRRLGPSLLMGNAAWLQRRIGNQAVGQLLRQGAPASAIVQRDVPWKGLIKTKEKELYGIPRQGAMDLVSKAGAPPPKPVGLYTQTRDVTDDGALATIWTPNVIFMQKKEVDPTGRDSDVDEFGKPALAKWQLEALAKIRDFEATLLTAQKGSARSDWKGPSLGILGLNDCAGWAHRLRGLIGEEERRARKLARPKENTPRVPFNLGLKGDPDSLPPVGVGDTMTQQLFGDEVGSNYHAATVVASDTSTIVTLEAHVEKSLRAPVFHFYDEGLPGFIETNNEGDTYREINKGGVGDIARFQVPTQKFYEELTDNLTWFQQVLEKDPTDFNSQYLALNRFKEVVSKPTITVKVKGETEDSCLTQ
jgi:hypothetical protein